MDLQGWDYTGRNIGSDLHRQFRIFCSCLSDPTFVNHCTWGNPIQDKIAQKMHASSSGAIRTIKRMFVNFGLIDPKVINSRTELHGQPFLTKRGEILLQAATLEEQVEKSDYDPVTKAKAVKDIKALYEEVYCDALAHYFIKNDDGTFFFPLRATLIALDKYKKMDKWEWYLMNTFIRHDDNASEQATLDKYIQDYRAGKISFTMKNVKEKPKGHQYTPQHYDFAGLVHLVQRPDWVISSSNAHTDIKQLVLSDSYLKKLYYGRS